MYNTLHKRVKPTVNFIIKNIILCIMKRCYFMVQINANTCILYFFFHRTFVIHRVNRLMFYQTSFVIPELDFGTFDPVNYNKRNAPTALTPVPPGKIYHNMFTTVVTLESICSNYSVIGTTIVPV